MDFQSKASGPLSGGLCAPSVHVGVDPGKGDITAVWIDESAEIPQEAWDRLRGECQPASPERVAALRAAGQRARDVPIAEASAAEPERSGATLWPIPLPASSEALEREIAPAAAQKSNSVTQTLHVTLGLNAVQAAMNEVLQKMQRDLASAMAVPPSMLSGGRGVQPDSPATSTLSRAFRLAVPSDDPRLGVAAFLPREG